MSKDSMLELEKRMRPGAWSNLGFLGQSESLEAVIAQDSQTLKELGVSYEQIATALENVLQSMMNQRDRLLKSRNYAEYNKRESYARKADPSSTPRFTSGDLPGTDIGYLVDNKFQIFIAQWRGLQECPWECEYENWSSFDFLILNRQSGKYMTGPGLIVHLIRVHHFFEGFESPYRVDPARVVEVLDIVPGASVD